MRFLRISPVSEKMENNLNGELEFMCYLQNRKWTYGDALLWIGKMLKEYHASAKMLEELDEVRQALNELPQTGS